MSNGALVGLAEIADLAGTSYEVVRRLERDGLLPPAHLPKPYRQRWRRRDVLDWLGLDVREHAGLR